MSKPLPKQISPEDVRKLAQAVVAADRAPMLATVDGSWPRVRPVSPVRTEGFTIYVANLRGYHKTQEIAAQPNVELCYMNDGHDQVRISGVAEVLTDASVLQQIWDTNPLLRQYLGTPQNPELIVYCIRPVRVRYMQEWGLEYFEVEVGGSGEGCV